MNSDTCFSASAIFVKDEFKVWRRKTLEGVVKSFACLYIAGVILRVNLDDLVKCV